MTHFRASISARLSKPSKCINSFHVLYNHIANYSDLMTLPLDKASVQSRNAKRMSHSNKNIFTLISEIVMTHSNVIV